MVSAAAAAAATTCIDIATLPRPKSPERRGVTACVCVCAACGACRAWVWLR